MEKLDFMRSEAKKQIEQLEEDNFNRFCEFVDEIEAHDATKVFEGLAAIQREEALAKLIQFSLQQQVIRGEI